MLGDIGFWDVINSNWATICAAATVLGGAIASLLGAVGYGLKKFVDWFGKRADEIVDGHLKYLDESQAEQRHINERLAGIEIKIGDNFIRHGQAITHTADGLLAHVDGKPDEAKQFAAKAKDAVR